MLVDLTREKKRVLQAFLSSRASHTHRERCHLSMNILNNCWDLFTIGIPEARGA